MAWRKNLRPASFRGVPFFVDGHEAELGRRVAVHEFPLRDKPYAEDLGRATRKLTIDAYVLGADYMAVRDRLLLAMEQAGAGALVHPYLGELQVTVTSCRLRESTAEGGLARLTLEMVEAGESLFVQASTTNDVVATRRDQLLGSCDRSFVARYSVQGRPEFVANAAKGVVTDAVNQVQGALAKVRTVSQAAATLQQQVRAIKQNVIGLVYAPAQLAHELLGSLRQLVRDVAEGPREALALARRFYDFGSGLGVVPLTTPAREQQARNQTALVRLMRVGALAEAAGAAAQLEFESVADARAISGELANALEAEMEQPDVDDALYSAMRALRTAMVQDVANRGADLAVVVTYAPATTMPALLLAHQLYGDATRADEVVTRNRLPHPCFVPGRRALEVLSDG